MVRGVGTPADWKDTVLGACLNVDFVVTVAQGEVCDLWDDVPSDSFLACPLIRGRGDLVLFEAPPHSDQQLPDVVSTLRMGKFTWW